MASRRGRDGSRRAAGELETEVLAQLWAADGPLTAGQVVDQLGDGLAYNTVQTILVRLFDKGLVQRTAEDGGRRHRYAPSAMAAEQAAQQMAAWLEHGPDHLMVLQRFVTALSAEDERALRSLLRNHSR